MHRLIGHVRPWPYSETLPIQTDVPVLFLLAEAYDHSAVAQQLVKLGLLVVQQRCNDCR